VPPCSNPLPPPLPSRTMRLLLPNRTTPLRLRLRLPLLLLWLALVATLTRKSLLFLSLSTSYRRSSRSACPPSTVARAAAPRVVTLSLTKRDSSTPTCLTSEVETVEGVECRALVLLTPVTLREIATVVNFFYSRPPLGRG
jgi:hypothetical protein